VGGIMNDPWDDTTRSQMGIVVTATGLRVPVAGATSSSGWPAASTRTAAAPAAASAQYRGVGPKGYRRSDPRVREYVCDQLLLDPYLDASRIVVRVANGRVVLTGSVPNERMRESAVAVASNAAAGAVDDKLQVTAPAQRPSRVTAARPRSRKTVKTKRGGQR
jgi:osmotically-inducible protein OsmY